MLEGTGALAGRRDRQDRQHLGSSTLNIRDCSLTTVWRNKLPSVESRHSTALNTRPHPHHNWLQTHQKSSTKARLSTQTLGLVYFWLFPPRAPPTHSPLAYSLCYGIAATGCRQSSYKSAGITIFGWVHYSLGLYPSRTFESVVRRITGTFCVFWWTRLMT